MKKYFIFSVTFALMLSAFQNCAVSDSQDGTMDAASCLQNSVLKAAYPQGRVAILPVGQTNTPYACVNNSPFSNLTFDARTQTLTLGGNSGSETFELISGEAGCRGSVQFGGDTWGGRNAIQLQTALSPKNAQGTRTLKITSDANLNCEIEF